MNPNEPHIASNLFSPEEIKAITSLIDSAISSNNHRQDQRLGRLLIEDVPLPESICNTLDSLALDLTGRALYTNATVSVAEYSNKYGAPELPPHFDGDDNELIVDYQLSSNTRWPLGINKSAYDLQDNSAVMFNPNTNVHWRPHKTFKDGEYVRMMFFRFYQDSPPDYSHLPNHPDDPIFEEVREYRNSFSIDQT